MAKTWVLTGSLDNFRATGEHGFSVIGANDGRRRMAERVTIDAYPWRFPTAPRAGVRAPA